MKENEFSKLLDFDSSLSYQVDKDSLEWWILSYYRLLTVEQVREKILTAGTAFWWSLARRRIEPEQLAINSLLCIHKLKHQQEVIREYWKKVLPTYQGQPLNQEPFCFKFRYRQRVNQNTKVLLDYVLAEEDVFSPVEKLLWSSGAYWSFSAAMALKAEKEVVEDIQALCLKQLENQIQFLERLKSTPILANNNSDKKSEGDNNRDSEGDNNRDSEGDNSNEPILDDYDLYYQPIDDQIKWE